MCKKSLIYRNIAMTAVLSFLFIPLSSAPVLSSARQWKTYTTANGLVDNRILAITQDNKGNLWFGTQGGGAIKYDGKNFRSFTAQDGLSHYHVQCILFTTRDTSKSQPSCHTTMFSVFFRMIKAIFGWERETG